VKILFVISTMRPGGAERAMSYLTNYFVESGCDVGLLTLAPPDEEQFYFLNPLLKQFRIGLLGGRDNWWRIARIFKRFIVIRRIVFQEKPDLVISFMDTMNITVLISCIGLRQSVIVSERVDPALHQLGRIRHMLRLLAYPLANKIVVQTNKIKKYFPAYLQRDIQVIPNAVPESYYHAEPDRALASRFRIVAVGRLHTQKGFDLLISAFAGISHQFPKWDLVIFGEGPEREDLERRVANFNLRDRVFLPGVTKEVIYEMSISHIMAFPSRYEGFPNALAEGLATGLPCIAFKDVSGVHELIVDGVTGVIVNSAPESNSLAARLAELMSDSAQRVKLGQSAIKHISQWDPDHIHKIWYDLVNRYRK
jgi:GalNAc-alpha-(1->4)-GalNAc-alpha-(1->3)-diNAcBac-PP-undecaprenol alpha-1,4-N-acetyl-D-galactosaminyltransferase